jgi:hypothetical protein
MTTSELLDTSASVLSKVLDILLLIITLVLGVLTFLSILEILLTVGAFIVARTVDPIEESIRQKYILITIRNIWYFLGGALFLGFVVGSVDYYPRHLGETKSHRFLLTTCLIEIIIIGLHLLITG